MTPSTPTAFDTEEMEPMVEIPLTDSQTPLFVYRSNEGILLVHPDRHGQHHLVYGTSGFLYDFDPAQARPTDLTVEHLERTGGPTWASVATAPVLEPSYELRTDTPEDNEVLLACVAPHGTFLPAVYTRDAFRLIAEENAHHEALPELSPVIGWLPLPIVLEDLFL